MDNRDHHLNQVLSSYIGKADEKSAWMAPASEQIRKWREEDRARGIIWEDGK